MSTDEYIELAPYYEKASRLELIIRWVYGIAIGIIYWLWSIWAGICIFLHFWYILLLGRRSKTFYKHTRRYVNALPYVNSYLNFLTDARPTLIPNIVLYYKEVKSS